MRLTFHTDYALRMLIYLAVDPDRLATIQEISDSYGISRNHLMKVAQELGGHGFLETVRGRGGGLRLSRAQEEISLGSVVRAMEEDFRIVECFDPERNSCVINGACSLKNILNESLAAWLAVLDRYTLADLVTHPRPLADRLGIPFGESPPERKTPAKP